MRWEDDPKERPTWGSFINMSISPFEFPPEVDAKIAETRERATLLRATEVEGNPEQELLRTVKSKEEFDPHEMLRSSDKSG